MEFWQDNNSHEGVWLAVYCWFDNLMQDNHIENTYKLVHTNIVLQRPVWRCTTTQWRKHLPVCCTVCTRSPQPANWGRTSARHIHIARQSNCLLLSHTHRHTHTHTHVKFCFSIPPASSTAAVCMCLFVYVCRHMNFLFSSSSWEHASVLTAGHQLCSVFFWSVWTYTHARAHSSCVVTLFRCSGLQLLVQCHTGFSVQTSRGRLWLCSIAMCYIRTEDVLYQN